MGVVALRRRIAKWALGGLLLICWTYLALFHFDVRCFYGFTLLTEFDGDVLFMNTDERYIDDTLVQIYRCSKCPEFEADPIQGEKFNLSVEGPTVLRFKSGRLRITHGVYILGPRHGAAVVYAQ